MTMRWFGTRAVIAIMAMTCLAAGDARAFRPFDGTDASVARPRLFELELSPLSYSRIGSERTLIAPLVTFNIGVRPGLELTLEGHNEMLMNPEPEAVAPKLTDAEFSFKKLLRAGVLQDKPGPSIATEEGINIPGSGQVHAGLGGSLILSQPLTGTRTMLHLNADLARTSEGETERFVSMILEGPEAWPVRPVGELSWERTGSADGARGYLAGVIWQTRQGLTMDAALKAVDGEEHGLEVRSGFTWHMQLHKP